MTSSPYPTEFSTLRSLGALQHQIVKLEVNQLKATESEQEGECNQGQRTHLQAREDAGQWAVGWAVGSGHQTKLILTGNTKL